MQLHSYKYNAEQIIRDNSALVLVPIINSDAAWHNHSTSWAALPKEEADPILAQVRAKVGKLTIELRNVKVAAFASEETNCFTADIYVNGKKEGRAHNQGHGGPTDIDPHTLSTRLDVYGATLPRKVSDIGDNTDPSGFFTYQPDAENIVDDLLQTYLEAKDAEKADKKLQRDLQTRVVFTVKGKKGIYHTQKMEAARLKYVVEKRLVKDADIILNTLPFAEAKKVYDANVQVVYR